MTDFRMPTMLTAGQLITRLGTYPTLTFPVCGAAAVDVTPIWEFLREPAEYFGLPVPPAGHLDAAVTRFLAAAGERSGQVFAVTVTLIDTDGGRFLVSGSAVTPVSADPVWIGLVDSAWPQPTAADPYWMRMAARTTSLGALDHLLGRLRERGCADGIRPGSEVSTPVAGALVADTGEALIGLAGTEPRNIIDQLERGGLLRPGVVRRPSAVAMPDVVRAWWISPQYRMHPVAQLGEQPLSVDSSYPPFLEQL